MIPKPKYEISIDLIPENLCLLSMREECLLHGIDSNLSHSDERAKPCKYKEKASFSTFKSQFKGSAFLLELSFRYKKIKKKKKVVPLRFAVLSGVQTVDASGKENKHLDTG